MATAPKFSRKYGIKNIQKEEAFPAEQGVFYSNQSQKWVVRIENKSKTRAQKPFISVAQFASESLANTHLENLLEKESCAN